MCTEHLCFDFSNEELLLSKGLVSGHQRENICILWSTEHFLSCKNCPNFKFSKNNIIVFFKRDSYKTCLPLNSGAWSYKTFKPESVRALLDLMCFCQTAQPYQCVATHPKEVCEFDHVLIKGKANDCLTDDHRLEPHLLWRLMIMQSHEIRWTSKANCMCCCSRTHATQYPHSSLQVLSVSILNLRCLEDLCHRSTYISSCAQTDRHRITYPMFLETGL